MVVVQLEFGMMHAGDRVYQAQAQPAARRMFRTGQTNTPFECVCPVGCRYARPIVGNDELQAGRIPDQSHLDRATGWREFERVVNEVRERVRQQLPAATYDFRCRRRRRAV